MLNEGYALYKSLERCGIVPPQRHPDIKKMGKKNGLIAGINDEGKVASVEFRNSIEMSKLWTIRDGNKNSFPGMTLSLGLLNLDAYYEKEIRPISEINDNTNLKRIWLDYGLNLKLKKGNEKNFKQPMIADWKRVIEKLQGRKSDIENIGQEAIAYKTLLERMLKNNYEDSDRDIASDIAVNIFVNLEKGLLRFEDVKDFLVTEKPGSFIFFDVYEYEKYENRVASPDIIDFISDYLLQHASVNVTNINESIASALTGKPNANIGDKFPNPNLNFIGITNLFGVDKNTPCLKRYEQISTKIFPVDTNEANNIQDSLVWITNEIRRGKTWFPVPSFNDGDSDLLIVYLENKPNLNVNNAHLLGGVSKNDFSESTYEAISSIAIKALKAEKIIKANDLIRLFALRKADKGRTQVSLQRIYTINDLVKADEEWREAAMNFPNISFPFFRKEIEKSVANQVDISKSIKAFLDDKDSNLIVLKPNSPFPADLVRLTQRQWIRGERDFTPVAGCSIGDIYDVFFAKENEKKQITENLLVRTLQCTKILLMDCGNTDHQKVLKSFSKIKRFTVLKTVSALAIYLYKLGIKKENYMKDTFFYVGRFLSLIDTLHFEWCKFVRGGYPEKEEKVWRKAIPPQLLGNAHLQIALDNPVSAIDMLSRRINIYQAWTKKEQGEQVKLARWAVGELGKVADLLSDKNLPSSTSSIERAQILLGYLARSESKSESSSDNDIKKNNKNN